MAYAALAALLEAAPDWIQADGSGPKCGDMQGKQQRELSAMESNTMTALVNNALGMPAKMLLDWGDHQVSGLVPLSSIDGFIFVHKAWAAGPKVRPFHANCLLCRSTIILTSNSLSNVEPGCITATRTICMSCSVV